MVIQKPPQGERCVKNLRGKNTPNCTNYTGASGGTDICTVHGFVRALQAQEQSNRFNGGNEEFYMTIQATSQPSEEHDNTGPGIITSGQQGKRGILYDGIDAKPTLRGTR
jgi:hypothetical protein